MVWLSLVVLGDFELGAFLVHISCSLISKSIVRGLQHNLFTLVILQDLES